MQIMEKYSVEDMTIIIVTMAISSINLGANIG